MCFLSIFHWKGSTKKIKKKKCISQNIRFYWSLALFHDEKARNTHNYALPYLKCHTLFQFLGNRYLYDLLSTPKSLYLFPYLSHDLPVDDTLEQNPGLTLFKSAQEMCIRNGVISAVYNVLVIIKPLSWSHPIRTPLRSSLLSWGLLWDFMVSQFWSKINLIYSHTSLIRPLIIQLFANPAKNLLEQIFPY